MEDIESGLASLVADVRRLKIQPVAVPALGCGLGGLPWAEVQQRMREAFEQLPEVRWLVFEPMSVYPDREDISANSVKQGPQ